MGDLTALDHERLTLAYDLAERAVGLSEPNPRVGCVIGTADGAILGTGHTQRAGEAHAEVMALRDARANGHSTRGATAWCTLEPCAHHGRTPPCADALVEAGIARVVVGARDPFAQVDGRGLERLRAAGIDVVMGGEPFATRCRELNIGFFSRCERGRPWVRVKVAASLDGRVALLDGRSRWITSEAARADGHAWRRRAGAVLTGIGTVLADDPQLDVRSVPTTVQPIKAVVDRQLRTPTDARLFDAARAVVLYCGADRLAEGSPYGDRAQCVAVPEVERALDWGWMLADLARRQINELHVEAGPRVNASLAAGGWVDEWLVYLAPKLLGQGQPMAALPEPAQLDGAHTWAWFDAVPVGPDLRLRLRRRAG